MYEKGDIAEAQADTSLVVLPTELHVRILGDANAARTLAYLCSYLGMLILYIETLRLQPAK